MTKPKVIGIAGDGQLGRMLAVAASGLGYEVVVLGPTPGSPASAYARQVMGDFRESAPITEFGRRADVLTFEIEDVHAGALIDLRSQGLEVHPSPETLARIKDKFRQKQLFAEHGIPVAAFRAVTSEADIAAAGHDFGYPLVLKARLGSYDGRGNALISSPADISEAIAKLGGRQWYVEAHVPFVRELAVVAARDRQGNVAAYPVVETRHVRHICDTVIAPAQVDTITARQAGELAAGVLDTLQGVGVFGIEMFETPDGQVLVNEVAPRVHNSGHWTIEGAATSQFEQHIRAVVGLPLGPTTLTHPASVMVNILGERNGPAEPTGVDDALKIPGVAVHLYGKHDTKVDRKMGHITATADTPAAALANARRARAVVSI
jgi:5-(carboxyamino)imidazole ribonucleotide synthase